MSWPERIGLGLIVVIQVLAGLIAASVFFVEETDRFDSDANVLISTFGIGMAFFGIAITLFPLRRGELWGWAVLWAWPVFFIAHVIALGTVIPDLVLAILFAFALGLVVARAPWTVRRET